MNNNFKNYISKEIPVLVYFFSEQKKSHEIIQSILLYVKKLAGSSVLILKIDIEKNPVYLENYLIFSTPTLMIFKNGKSIWRKSGEITANEILQYLLLYAV